MDWYMEADAVLFCFSSMKSSCMIAIYQTLRYQYAAKLSSCLVHALDPLKAFLAALVHNMEEWELVS
jgi:hypothetical protein